MFIGTRYCDIKAILKNDPEFNCEVFSILYEEIGFPAKVELES